jgi:ribosome-binding factor A
MKAYRIEKIAGILQREISQMILQELTDPQLGFITVTRVEPTPDLKSAKVFISVLGVKSSQEESLACLKKASGYMQKLLGSRLRMRFIPNISFHLDDIIEKLIGNNIDIAAQNAEISQKIKRR